MNDYYRLQKKEVGRKDFRYVQKWTTEDEMYF